LCQGELYSDFKKPKTEARESAFECFNFWQCSRARKRKKRTMETGPVPAVKKRAELGGLIFQLPDTRYHRKVSSAEHKLRKSLLSKDHILPIGKKRQYKITSRQTSASRKEKNNVMLQKTVKSLRNAKKFGKSYQRGHQVGGDFLGSEKDNTEKNKKNSF